MSLFTVTDLHVSVPTGKTTLEIVRGVSFSLDAGGFHALVGESGCGKSMTALALTQLPPTEAKLCSGRVMLGDRDILALRGAQLREIRGQGGISYIFQDPMSALNPVLSIGTQLKESLPRRITRVAVKSRMLELLEMVGLPNGEQILNSYPCELSGGMAQRICIAMAMASSPRVLVADEPTTALDVITQKRVMELLAKLCRETGVAIVLITHNLGLVAGYAKDVSVMYAGQIVEQGSVEAVLRNPRHPYTQGLLAAVPSLDDGDVESLATIPGRVPSPREWGSGCAFAPRCSFATPECAVLECCPRVGADLTTDFTD